jgi:triosephosphate isomerase
MHLIAGNWKMHGMRADIAQLEALVAAHVPASVQMLVCPPATLVSAFADRAAGTAVRIGAQDCHVARSGAHTGDLSADMLADAGATHVIVGHSERRADHGETDAIVKAKCEAAQRAHLTPILCIGETRAERDAGRTLDVVGRQLQAALPAAAPLVIAYEPVWAIGTGRTPTSREIADVHAFIAGCVPPGTPILYGGSVKPDNAADILAIGHVSGALVGGASLKAADFLAIARAAP